MPGQLGTPRWTQARERRDAANHPEGRPDVYNRAAQDVCFSFTAQHDYSTGAHAATGIITLENKTYTGNGTDNRNISLNNSNLNIYILLIWRDDSEYQVFKTRDMTGDNTKELETNAFQANQIQDITTTGQFQVGNNTTVNESGITYYYLAIGTI